MRPSKGIPASQSLPQQQGLVSRGQGVWLSTQKGQLPQLQDPRDFQSRPWTEGSLSTGFSLKGPAFRDCPTPHCPPLQLYVCHAHHSSDSDPGNSVLTILMKSLLRGDPEAGEK